MGIHLEKYATTIPGAVRQGAVLHALVSKEQAWLQRQQPETVERNRTLWNAIYNVHRLGTHEATQQGEYHPYMIREEKGSPVLGIGTIITKMAVTNPKLPTFTRKVVGNDIDGWIKAGSDNGLHRAVAQALLDKSSEINRKNPTIPPHDASGVLVSPKSIIGEDISFAVIPEDAPNPLRGLISLMDARGPVANLIAPADQTYDIAKGGHAAQLYVRERHIVG